MELMILAVLVLVVSGVGIGLFHHLGWEDRLKTVAEIFSTGMHAVTQRVSQAYFENFLPAVRRTKIITIGMVALLAVLAWFIGLPVRASVGLTMLAAVICVFVALLDRQGRMENGDLVVQTGRVVTGMSVITTGNRVVRAVYPPFMEETDIEVTPYDTSMKRHDPARARLATPPATFGPGQYIIESQGPGGFTIRLHANAGADIHFRWRVSLHEVEVDQGFTPGFGQRPILSVTPFDRAAGYDIPQLRPNGFVTRMSPAPVADSHFTWRAAERPEGNPALRIVSTAYTAFAVIGIALFAAGIACNSRQAVLLSIVPVAMAIATFFALARFFVWVAEKTAGMAEFGPNIGIQLLVMGLKRDFSRAEEVLKDAVESRTQAANLVDQEQFKKVWKHNLLKIIAALSSIYGIAILAPYGWAMLAWTTCLVSSWLWIHQYEYRINHLKLEADQALCDIEDAKKRGAPAPVLEEIGSRAKSLAGLQSFLMGRLMRLRLTGLAFFIAMTSAILVLVVVMIVVPGGEAMVNAFIKDVVDMVSEIFGGTHKGFGWIAGKSIASYTPALFAAIIAGLAAAAIHGTGEDKLRKWASYPFAALSIVAFLAFTAGALTATAAVVRDETVGAGKLIEVNNDLRAGVVDGKPELSWSAMTGATGFTVERRRATETKSVPVAEIALGTTAWRDWKTVDGETYFYRLVTKTGTGSSIISNEVSVLNETKTVDGLKAEVVDGTPELSWSAIPGAMRFKVQRRQATDASFTDAEGAEKLAIGVTTWQDTTATNGETYFYRLVTTTGKGDVFSKEVKVSAPKTACTGLKCGRNVALAQYCAENPGACP